MKRGKLTQLLAVTFALSLGLSSTMIAGAEDAGTEEAAVIVEDAGAAEETAAVEASEEAAAVEAATEADLSAAQFSDDQEASDASAVALEESASSEAAVINIEDQEDAGETDGTEAWLVTGTNASANGVDWKSVSFGYVSPATRWTITRVDGGYTIQDSEGNYLSWDMDGTADAKVSAEETVLGISNVSYDGIKGGMAISLADGDSTSCLSAISETSFVGVSDGASSDEDILFYILVETVNGNTTTWTKVTDVNEISYDGTYIIINRETCCALTVSEESVTSVTETEEAAEAPAVVSDEDSILVSIEAVDEDSIPDEAAAETADSENNETEAITEAVEAPVAEETTDAETEAVTEGVTEDTIEAEIIIAEEITIDVAEEATEAAAAEADIAEADVIIE